jgi:hypothetical protein
VAIRTYNLIHGFKIHGLKFPLSVDLRAPLETTKRKGRKFQLKIEVPLEKAVFSKYFLCFVWKEWERHAINFLGLGASFSCIRTKEDVA